MLSLVIKAIGRRPLRTGLTVAGIAIAVSILLLIDQIAASYRAKLMLELDSMGMHLMLVPLGCPYDAAARVLKGNSLEHSLPESAINEVRRESEIEIAAPLLIAAFPKPNEGRTDMFVGLDEQGIALKSWWKAAHGSARFAGPDSLILGADAAELEMREPGEKLFSPETGRTFKVAGILERSGMSDDSLFFVPLATAQRMFNSPERLTAIAIRLRDPAKLPEVSKRLETIAGAQVVTQTEMMGTFLNILGTVRTLLYSVAMVTLVSSIAGLLNALLMSVAERGYEFALYRALGASRRQVFLLIVLESLAAACLGLGAGFLLSWLFGSAAISLAAAQLPLLPVISFRLQLAAVAPLAMMGLLLAVVASLGPAWRACQTPPADTLKGG